MFKIHSSIVISLIAALTTAGCGSKQSQQGNLAVVSQMDSNEVWQVQSDLSHVLTNLYAGNAGPVFDSMPTEVIVAMGGKAKAKVILENAIQEMQTAEMKMESLGFPDRPTFLKSDSHQFAVVPTRNVIAIRGQRIKSLHFQLGIKEVGATNWMFMDGSKVNPTTLKSFFPDFPANYKFPRLDKEKL